MATKPPKVKGTVKPMAKAEYLKQLESHMDAYFSWYATGEVESAVAKAILGDFKKRVGEDQLMWNVIGED